MGTLEEEVPHLLEAFGGIYYYNYNGHLFTVFPSPLSTQVQTENSWPSQTNTLTISSRTGLCGITINIFIFSYLTDIWNVYSHWIPASLSGSWETDLPKATGTILVTNYMLLLLSPSLTAQSLVLFKGQRSKSHFINVSVSSTCPFLKHSLST